MLVPAVLSNVARTALLINARLLAASADLAASVMLAPVALLNAARLAREVKSPAALKSSSSERALLMG